MLRLRGGSGIWRRACLGLSRSREIQDVGESGRPVTFAGAKLLVPRLSADGARGRTKHWCSPRRTGSVLDGLDLEAVKGKAGVLRSPLGKPVEKRDAENHGLVGAEVGQYLEQGLEIKAANWSDAEGGAVLSDSADHVVVLCLCGAR